MKDIIIRFGFFILFVFNFCFSEPIIPESAFQEIKSYETFFFFLIIIFLKIIYFYNFNFEKNFYLLLNICLLIFFFLFCLF